MKHTRFTRNIGLATTAALLLTTTSLAARPLSDATERNARVVAEIELDGASLTFVDETIDGVFGFGILEQGAIDLGPFYEAGASELEIFLAFAPNGAEVPAALARAHAEARKRNPDIPAAPRTDLVDAGSTRALPNYAFTQDTSECWGWGDVPPGSYHPIVGNESHDHANARTNFLDWTGITGFGTGLFTLAKSRQDAEFGPVDYWTPFGHERAFAICVTHAEVQPDENPWLCGETYSEFYNTVNYRLRIWGQREYGNPWSSEQINLTAYGQGARYRSTSSELRKYRLAVDDISIKSSFCKEQFEVFGRNYRKPNDLDFIPK